MKPLPTVALVVSGVLPLAIAVACGADGETPSTCPDLLPYDLKVDGGVSQEARQRLQEAIRAGCVTPAGTAVTEIFDGGSRG